VLSAGGLVLAAVCARPVRACEVQAEFLRVVHPWTRATAPGADSAVLGMTIDQVTKDDRLVAVQTPVANGAVLVQDGQSGPLDLPLPARIEFVGIETSDLHPDPAKPGHFLLMAGLRNRAPFAQRWPDLELTLTDALDQALVRRVLAPADYLPPELAGGDGFAARGEQALRLAVDAPGIAAVGYRLYVFYP